MSSGPASAASGYELSMDTEANKQVIRRLVETVWLSRNLAALPEFWTAGCVNHAMPPGTDNRGLAMLHAYHEQFFSAFAAFSEIKIEIVQQVAEAGKVVTQMTTRARHTGAFMGISPTGKAVTLETIRIDRLENGKIAEHWSVADMAGLMQQLHG